MYTAENAAAPRLVDLATPLTDDTRLELVTEKDPEALKVVRHSAAHVLATAVLELFPETKLGHGPATDSGFFYDFFREKPFTPEDLPRIEAKMAERRARPASSIRSQHVSLRRHAHALSGSWDGSGYTARALACMLAAALPVAALAADAPAAFDRVHERGAVHASLCRMRADRDRTAGQAAQRCLAARIPRR